MSKKQRYSAGMMSIPFLFMETRKTAQFLLEGKTNAEVKQTVLSDNLYQMESLYRAERYFNVIQRRLSSLPAALIREIAMGDLQQAKQLLIIAIVRTDLLFREFMDEVFRLELQLGTPLLEDMRINLFFDAKARLSDTISGWRETTVSHLKQYYIRILFEAGLLSDIRPPRSIQSAYFTDAVAQTMKNNDLEQELNIMTGGRYA